jgi:hypothetical protein
MRRLGVIILFFILILLGLIAVWFAPHSVAVEQQCRWAGWARFKPDSQTYVRWHMTYCLPADPSAEQLRKWGEWRAAAVYRARRAHWIWLLEFKRSPVLAISLVFGAYGSQAIRVADCESGLSRNAANGQYLGLFQMGSSERAQFGHGPGALTQSRAAYRYFVASGRDWSPWACKP